MPSVANARCPNVVLESDTRMGTAVLPR